MDSDDIWLLIATLAGFMILGLRLFCSHEEEMAHINRGDIKDDSGHWIHHAP